MRSGIRSSGRGRILNNLGSLCVLAMTLLSAPAIAQVATSELQVHYYPMAKAFLHQPYQWQFSAGGGVPPLQWHLTGGAAPDGLEIKADGTVSGKPQQAGEFHLVMTVTDSAHPEQERTQEFVLMVAIPLQIDWVRPPAVNGRRIEGVVRVSNGTEQNFDLTVVIVAVNEQGRATALGYQKVTLEKEQWDKEIPFGENLPLGTYQVNADAVGEVAATNNIYRARLVSDNLAVQQGP